MCKDTRGWGCKDIYGQGLQEEHVGGAGGWCKDMHGQEVAEGVAELCRGCRRRMQGHAWTGDAGAGC